MVAWAEHPPPLDVVTSCACALGDSHLKRRGRPGSNRILQDSPLSGEVRAAAPDNRYPDDFGNALGRNGGFWRKTPQGLSLLFVEQHPASAGVGKSTKFDDPSSCCPPCFHEVFGLRLCCGEVLDRAVRRPSAWIIAPRPRQSGSRRSRCSVGVSGTGEVLHHPMCIRQPISAADSSFSRSGPLLERHIPCSDEENQGD